MSKLPPEAIREIAMRSSDTNVTSYDSVSVQAAVDMITDEAVLFDIAMNALTFTGGNDAARRITDKMLLTTLMKKAPHFHVREVAIAKVHDHPAVGIRKGLIEKITDQEVLLDIIKHCKDTSQEPLRAYAVRKLTDPALLLQYAKSHDAFYVRQAAASQLTDQKMLKEIALHDPHDDVRGTALTRVTDNAFLMRIAKNDASPYVRSCAVGNITDEAFLRDIAANDPARWVRDAAMIIISKAR
jgi:hypothetical protein